MSDKERRIAITRAAQRELADSQRWYNAAGYHNSNTPAARRFRLDAAAAVMRATRLLNHLADRRALPDGLEAAVKAEMARGVITSTHELARESQQDTDEASEVA